jgi:hypothetical protein
MFLPSQLIALRGYGLIALPLRALMPSLSIWRRMVDFCDLRGVQARVTAVAFLAMARRNV